MIFCPIIKINHSEVLSIDSGKISIVIPTYYEARNIPVLIKKINNAMNWHKLKYEIIIVDDNSKDGIDQVVKRLQKKYSVKLKIREKERGLSSAVITGFSLSKGDIIVVMDADLSHPPEKIPELLKPIIDDKAEFVIGSRFVEGGSAPHFNWYRKLNALMSRILARPFVNVKDPMAGFFAFPKKILPDLIVLSPLGFKIGLEILVKCAPKKIVEVPIRFHQRLYGESKLSMKEQILYVLHLKRLFNYKYKSLTEFLRFSLIGSSGMIVDLFFVFLTYDVLSFPFKIARVAGFIFALTSNFFLNKLITFPQSHNAKLMRQYVSFFIICFIGFSFNWSISVYLYEQFTFFHNYYLITAFIGILCGLSINYIGSKYFVFKTQKKSNN